VTLSLKSADAASVASYYLIISSLVAFWYTSYCPAITFEYIVKVCPLISIWY